MHSRALPIVKMATFVCTLCGKCCASFGAFIRIERQLTGRDYYCRYGITNEVFMAHVRPEFADEIEGEFLASDQHESGHVQKGCIFSRKNREGNGFACAIYETRPVICRDFRCYRMLIYRGAEKEPCGRVIGTSELRTHDEALAALWKEQVAGINNPAYGTDRENTITRILAAHGYRGDPVKE